MPVGRPAHPVVLGLEGPGPQRRATLAFRWIIAIPHFLYAAIVSIAALFAVVAGWFAALFTARLPDGIATFLARVVQYWARVTAYGYMLLTDRYPSFALDADDHISVAVAPGRLNRAAVLFRLVLMVPGYIVVSIVGSGYFVVALFAWLITLIKGRLPDSLFQAHTSILRYHIRFYAYAAMLTSEYPRGLFGDERELPPAAPETPPAATAAPPAATAAAPTPTPVTPPPGTTSGALVPTAGPPTPRITRLVLSRAAKRIVVLVLVLGSLIGIGSTANGVVTAIRSTETLRELDRHYEELLLAGEDYEFDTQNCAVTGGGLACLERANVRVAEAFDEFVAELRDMSFPAYSVDAARRVEEAAVRVEASLKDLADAGSPGQYQARVIEFQDTATRFDLAVADLYATLP